MKLTLEHIKFLIYQFENNEVSEHVFFKTLTEFCGKAYWEKIEKQKQTNTATNTLISKPHSSPNKTT